MSERQELSPALARALQRLSPELQQLYSSLEDTGNSTQQFESDEAAYMLYQLLHELDRRYEHRGRSIVIFYSPQQLSRPANLRSRHYPKVPQKCL